MAALMAAISFGALLKKKQIYFETKILVHTFNYNLSSTIKSKQS